MKEKTDLAYKNPKIVCIWPISDGCHTLLQIALFKDYKSNVCIKNM